MRRCQASTGCFKQCSTTGMDLSSWKPWTPVARCWHTLSKARRSGPECGLLAGKEGYPGLRSVRGCHGKVACGAAWVEQRFAGSSSPRAGRNARLECCSPHPRERVAAANKQPPRKRASLASIRASESSPTLFPACPSSAPRSRSRSSRPVACTGSSSRLQTSTRASLGTAATGSSTTTSSSRRTPSCKR